MTSEATPRSAARRTLTGVPPTTLAWAVLALLLLVAAAFIVHETRGTTFFSDEWTWILERRGGGLDTFLEPHNEHLSLIPVAIYKLLFATVGLEHYGPYRAMVIVAHLGVTVLLFVYANRRVGSIPALCAAALLLFLGPGWHNILWPFQIGWLISLGAGIGALLALDRANRKGSVTACALIAVSLASSGLGVAFALGVLVELAWGRRLWRDLWIAAVPLVPYAVWWAVYRPAGLERRAIDLAPAFAADSAAGAFGALAGLAGAGVPTGVDPLPWGRPLAVVAVFVLLWLLSRYKRVPPRILGLLTVMLAFWLLTGLRRAILADPDASRYLYVGGLFILLLMAELARGVSLPRRWTPLLIAAVALAVLSNAGTMRDAGRFLRASAESSRADLGALELARDSVPSGYVARGFPGYPFVILRAGPYFDATEAYGSPALSTADLVNASEPARLIADAELIRIHRIALHAAADAPLTGPAPRPTSVQGGKVSENGQCVSFRPDSVAADGAARSFELAVPSAGLLVTTGRAATKVEVRRFANGFSRPLANTVEASSAATLRIPRDRSSTPWKARVSPQERVSVCALR